MKAIEKLFGVSVAVISLTTLITTITGLIGFPLPRWALLAIGIVNLISLPLMIYSTVKSLREKALAAAKLSGKAAAKEVRSVGSALDVPAAPAEASKKVQPKPNAQQKAAKKAASGNKPKKGKKKKK